MNEKSIQDVLNENRFALVVLKVQKEMNEYFDYEILPKLDEIANRTMETQVVFTQLQLNSEGV